MKKSDLDMHIELHMNDEEFKIYFDRVDAKRRIAKDLLEYKGIYGSVNFSEADAIFHGKLEMIRDLVIYEGKNVAELKKAFIEAVEDYLSLCKKMGRKYEDATVKTVAAIELRRHFSTIIASVETGNEVIITKQGVPFAVIKPLARGNSPEKRIKTLEEKHKKGYGQYTIEKGGSVSEKKQIQKSLALLKILSQSEENLKTGKYKPLATAFRDLRKKWAANKVVRSRFKKTTKDSIPGKSK